MADYPKRILIVEDNKIDMRLLKDILESRGYETFQAEDGLEAIKLAFAGLWAERGQMSHARLFDRGVGDHSGSSRDLPQTSTVRRLAAILVADMVGYSRLWALRSSEI